MVKQLKPGITWFKVILTLVHDRRSRFGMLKKRRFLSEVGDACCPRPVFCTFGGPCALAFAYLRLATSGLAARSFAPAVEIRSAASLSGIVGSFAPIGESGQSYDLRRTFAAHLARCANPVLMQCISTAM